MKDGLRRMETIYQQKTDHNGWTLSGHAQHTLKSACITGILEAVTACMMESLRRLIDVTEALLFHEAVMTL